MSRPGTGSGDLGNRAPLLGIVGVALVAMSGSALLLIAGRRRRVATPDAPGAGEVVTGIGRDVPRDEALREDRDFFAKVTEVREALHGVHVSGSGREAR